VWIPRDLVLNNANDVDNQQKQAAIPPSPPVGDFKASASHKHVNSLLHDLEGQSTPSTQPAPKQTTQTATQQPSYRQHNHKSEVVTSATNKVPLTSAVDSNQVAPNQVDPNKIQRQITEIARTALHVIYACGDLNADWMVIGESPDVSTNGLGQPYAGDSGILLDNMLKAVGINEPRQNAYLLNVLKTSIEEVNEDINTQLNNLLVEQIQQVKPKILLVVGQVAAQNLLRCKEPLVRLRGKVHSITNLQIPLVVTYYPSYLLSKPIDKRKAWDDLKLAMQYIDQSSNKI